MNDLSPEAQALFARTRTAHDPGPGERRAVRRALALKIGAGTAGAAFLASGATAAADGAAVTPAALTWAALSKLLLAGFALGTVTAGAAEVVRRTFEPNPGREHAVADPAAARRSERALAPPPAGTPAPASKAPEDARVASAPSPSGRGTRAKALVPEQSPHSEPGPSTLAFPVSSEAHGTAPGERSSGARSPLSAPEAPPLDRLREEARALAAAQRALDQGNGAEALALLARQEREFARGALAEERVAARIFALCALGHTSRARDEALRFLASFPASPLAPRVRSACAER